MSPPVRTPEEAVKRLATLTNEFVGDAKIRHEMINLISIVGGVIYQLKRGAQEIQDQQHETPEG